MQRRKTNQEQIVFDSLEHLGHATSEELINYINENNNNISLATIYRNLTKLIEDKKVKKVKLGSVEVYETVKNKHYHFKCRSCGIVIDIDTEALPLDLDKIKSLNDDVIEDCDLVFYGICHTCKNKEKEGK